MRWVRIRDATKNSGVASGPFAVEDKGENDAATLQLST